MGVFLKYGIYQYKRQIEKRRYYRTLNVRKGQERLLSARIKQVDEQILAEHFGLPSPTLTGSIALSAFIPIYKRRKAGKASLDRDLVRLEKAVEIMGDRPLPSYKRDDFARLETRLLEGGLSKTTVNRYFQALHHAFDLAIAENYLRENPLARHEYFIEDAPGGRALTDEEIRTLFAALEALKDTPRPAASPSPFDQVRAVLCDMVRFGLYTGARYSEIANLRHDQISGDTARYRITETKFRKRGQQPHAREKLTYLSPHALAIIAAQPRTPDGHVFALPDDRHKIVSRFIARHRDSWGLPEFSFHWLRHTFVSRAVAHADPTLVRALVSHADIRTTMKYVHSQDDKKREIAAMMGAEFSGIEKKII